MCRFAISIFSSRFGRLCCSISTTREPRARTSTFWKRRIAPYRRREGFQILIPNVQAFTYENSVGDSEANAGSVRLRKRLASGFSIGGIYTFSKSIDDASSIGAGATVGSRERRLGRRRNGAGGGGTTASPGSGANSVAQNPSESFRASAGSPASIRRTNSPPTICGSCRSDMTSAG